MAKKKHEEHENHERWLVSYADFITLLFAFFVVMYSISSVNEGKFRTVSESIKAALNPIVSSPASPLPFKVGESKPAAIAPNFIPAKELAVKKLSQVIKLLKPTASMQTAKLVEQRDGSLVLSLPDDALFNSGEAAIRAEAIPFLQALAEALLELDRQVAVQGHTDNVPIRTAQFPSNWELSATRAVMVVRTLTELYGVSSRDLSASGYADSRPVTDNLTPENRAKNRRVEIVVQERKPPSQPVETEAPRTALELFAPPKDVLKKESISIPDEIPPELRPPAILSEPASGP